DAMDLGAALEVWSHPRFQRPLQVSVRETRLLRNAPWVHSLVKLTLEATTEGWRFPVPEQGSEIRNQRSENANQRSRPGNGGRTLVVDPRQQTTHSRSLTVATTRTRLRPPVDTVVFKERLLYLLQPPLENLLAGKQVLLPGQPYPYQLEGIAFLMPRHAAL